MGTYTLAEALKFASHRSGAPVRRSSLEAGTFEHRFWTAPRPGEADYHLKAARLYLDYERKAASASRAVGQTAMMSLTHSAVRVYEELCTLARVCAGKLYPSYEALARTTGLARATVARAIAALARNGFIEKQRRCIRVENAGAGPRFAQTSNAYRLVCPQKAARLIPVRRRPVPLPDDVSWAKQADRAALRAMEKVHPVQGMPGLSVKDPRLAAALSRMSSLITERESHFDTETKPEANNIAPNLMMSSPSRRTRKP